MLGGTKERVYVAVIAAACVMVITALISRAPRVATPTEQPKPRVTTPPASPRPLSKTEMKKEILRESREKFVANLQRTWGVEFIVKDNDGELVVRSYFASEGIDRDELLRRSFVQPTVRRNLCAIGFRTVSLVEAMDDIALTYSLGCPETEVQKKARSDH
jgi:hypothetical protein